MRLAVLLFVMGTSFNVFADCRNAVDDILKREAMTAQSPGVQHKDIEMDSQKILERREYLQRNAIYSYKRDSKYGDIFNLSEDVDGFIEEKKHFTVIHEHTKGKAKLRVFENTKTKTIQGFSYELNKRMEVFNFNADCSVNEVTVMLEGARCYLKKQECAEFTPVSAEKLQKKCSYFADFTEKSLTAFEKACEIMTAKVGANQPTAASTAGRKDKAPAVR